MIRNCSLEDISDGRTYGQNDMVKADTGNCEGCHLCCTGMGKSIVLDPFDVLRLKCVTGKDINNLLEEGYIELNIVDGLILPNLKMNEKDCCSFLNDEGRCTVHSSRPGICRLFPLGRVYNEMGFSYFFQNNQCPKNHTKIKVKKWIDVVSIGEYDRFILKWHNLIKCAGQKLINLKKAGMGEKTRDIAMYVLNTFYVSDVLCDTGISGNDILELQPDTANIIYHKLVEKIEEAEEAILK